MPGRRVLARWGNEGVVVPLDVAGEGVVDVDGGVGEAVGEFLAGLVAGGAIDEGGVDGSAGEGETDVGALVDVAGEGEEGLVVVDPIEECAGADILSGPERGEAEGGGWGVTDEDDAVHGGSVGGERVEVLAHGGAGVEEVDG